MPPRFPTEAERERREMLCALLDDGLVYVHLDARHDGASLPDHLADEPALVLKLSHGFHLETFDLGALEVVASLSFGGARFRCVLPYDAMFAFSTEHEPFVGYFPDAAPQEVIRALAVAIRPAPGPAEAPASADDVSGPEPRADTSRELRADPPTLRLVK